MPYRRGYVPPFPDFSKTGMSYSEETGKKTFIFKKSHIFLVPERGISPLKLKVDQSNLLNWSLIYLGSPGGCRGSSVLGASWTLDNHCKRPKRSGQQHRRSERRLCEHVGPDLSSGLSNEGQLPDAEFSGLLMDSGSSIWEEETNGSQSEGQEPGTCFSSDVAVCSLLLSF